MVMIRYLDKVGISCMTDFLDDAVQGPDLRVKAVVSGTESEVLQHEAAGLLPWFRAAVQV